MRSPILLLEHGIAASAFGIAPEREAELASWRDKTGFALSLTDEAGFAIRVNPRTGEAFLPIAALEFLWASAYAFFVTFDEYSKAQRTGATTFDINGNERTRTAWTLMKWGLTNVRDSAQSSWPSGLPQPVPSPEPRGDVHVANELFLCAIAWIIHHEIAHARLGHSPIESHYSINQEQEADLEATAWVLSKSAVAKEAQKRALGIATALISMQSLERAGPDAGFRTHPRAFERLDYCLRSAEIPDNDEVYAFSVVLMQMQLAGRGMSTAVSDRDTFAELLGEFLVAFARNG